MSQRTAVATPKPGTDARVRDDILHGQEQTPTAAPPQGTGGSPDAGGT
jgi:hypothetical protein